MQDMTQSDPIRPPSSPGGLPCHDLGRPTMIRLLPRASDGVAEPWLQSLDPGRASERPRASGPPAVFPWAAHNTALSGCERAFAFFASRIGTALSCTARRPGASGK